MEITQADITEIVNDGNLNVFQKSAAILKLIQDNQPQVHPSAVSISENGYLHRQEDREALAAEIQAFANAMCEKQRVICADAWHDDPDTDGVGYSVILNAPLPPLKVE